jgi:hypothetical protein
MANSFRGRRKNDSNLGPIFLFRFYLRFFYVWRGIPPNPGGLGREQSGVKKGTRQISSRAGSSTRE